MVVELIWAFVTTVLFYLQRLLLPPATEAVTIFPTPGMF
jgi:hypothetical protein